MSKAAGILSVTTALFAASTLYFAWAVGVERNRAADFRASPGTNAPDSRAGASGSDAAGAARAAGSGKSGDTQATESPSLLDGLRGLVGKGGKKRASRQQQGELFQEDFLRMYTDPATRKQLIEERIPGLRDDYLLLERQLDLPSDQWQRFLEIMATHAIERRGATAVCKQEIDCQMQALGPEAYARYDREIRDALGESDMKQFETFNYALSERQSVEKLQDELGPRQQLSEKTTEDLIAALSDVRRAAEKSIQAENGSFQLHRGDGYAVVFPPTLKTNVERLAYATEHFQKLQERAGSLLNPVQLATYQELQAKALGRLRRAMDSNPELAR